MSTNIQFTKIFVISHDPEYFCGNIEFALQNLHYSPSVMEIYENVPSLCESGSLPQNDFLVIFDFMKTDEHEREIIIKKVSEIFSGNSFASLLAVHSEELEIKNNIFLFPSVLNAREISRLFEAVDWDKRNHNSSYDYFQQERV